MYYPSRYLRPTVPRGLRLTERDRCVLAHVRTHRYLTSEHIGVLVFEGVSLRVVQRRLRLLFENGYLDRYFCPLVLTGTRQSARQSPRPLYTLARRGAAELTRAGLVTPGEPVHATPASNAQGFSTLTHHLVATDVLVALEAACQDRMDVELVSIEREDVMRRRVAQFGKERGLATYLVSDGAFTLRYPERGRTWTYHLEVVRALARSGNRTIEEKLRKYVRLRHDGYFRRVLGQDVRAVLILTTSDERVERYRTLAGNLTHGKRLFWFTSYGKEMKGGVPVTALRGSRVLSAVWRTALDEERRTLLDPT